MSLDRPIARPISTALARPMTGQRIAAADGLPSGALLTESGSALTTESGDTLIIE